MNWLFNTASKMATKLSLQFKQSYLAGTEQFFFFTVMKSPELYPLASSTHIGYGDVKVQIPTSPIQHERTKRSWNELLNAVIRPDDHGLDFSPGKQTTGESTQIQKDSHILNSPSIDEALPTYDEIRSGIPTNETKVEYGQKTSPRRDSADILKSGYYRILGFNFGVEKTRLCRNECVFTISNALQTVITEELMRSQSRPRLATL